MCALDRRCIVGSLAVSREGTFTLIAGNMIDEEIKKETRENELHAYSVLSLLHERRIRDGTRLVRHVLSP